MTLIALLDASGAVAEYPVSLRRLKQLFPTVGWTNPPRARTLARVGAVIVAPTARPARALGERITEGAPVLTGEIWAQTWVVTSPSAEEIASIKADLLEEAQDVAQQAVLRELANGSPLNGQGIAAVRSALARMKSDSGQQTLAQVQSALEELRGL